MFPRPVCIDDFEKYAKTVLPKPIYDYYRSGANDQETLADNVAAFSRLKLYPRMLRNVATVDLTTSVLGQRISMPICAASTAMQCMAHVDGEIATVRADDAREAVKYGVNGILVSNHGARQLDGVPATIDVLPEIVEAVEGKVEVFLDGGVRKGTDVLKALALGAKAVFVGRPVIWGLAYQGEKGVKAVLEMLKEEFQLAMALTGCRNVKDIDKTLVRTNPLVVSKI
ncbi:2-Hydroxyacid oxidase 1 isoform X2 [Notamacropus eugenii]|uniref:2-Hydroxyacid oxidase 1 isoform X2 n=1 Tax=Notamacropus eugenii TaxID=9315 RepID=UPI003B674625